MWPQNLPKDTSKPPVSILTPTYNRKRFIPACIACIQAQEYPKERIEWVILDDGTEPIWEIVAPYEKTMNIRYIRSEEKMTIGAKRNRLHKEARGEILVNMDDDDYYYPERVKHAVMTIIGRKANLVGSSCNTLYFTDDKSVWEVGPYGLNHGTFGTMAYTKKYAMEHPCDETVAFAEEIQFTNTYKEPLVQLDYRKVMIVMCHKENTFSKNKLRTDGNPNTRKTSMKLTKMIGDKKLRYFYVSC